MKGLNCSIFQDKMFGNCSNGGLSEACRTVTLLDVQYLNGRASNVPRSSKPDGSAPPVIIVERLLSSRDETYFTAYPCSWYGEQLVGPSMMGGCFIYSCDSRFPFDYPVPLHDREE